MPDGAAPSGAAPSRGDPDRDPTPLAPPGARPGRRGAGRRRHARPAGLAAGPIRIIVPFAAGGSTDAVARLVTPGLTQRFGQPVVVENRSGAAGSIGTDAVAKAAPDGLTWLLTFDSHATLPALLPSLPFNLTKDLDPVMLIGGAPYVVATPAGQALSQPGRIWWRRRRRSRMASPMAPPAMARSGT